MNAGMVIRNIVLKKQYTLFWISFAVVFASRCCINFPHELTCQILTNQSLKIGRRAWPMRDYGEKSEKYLSSLLVFSNNLLNFRVRGQFEIKMLIARGQSDINTTYFIWITKKFTWSCDHLKISNFSADNFKKYSSCMGRPLSPRYSQVILVSGYLVLTAVNEWFSSNVRLSYAHRIMGSPGGKHCKSLQRNVWLGAVSPLNQCLWTENAAFCRDFMRSGGD